MSEDPHYKIVMLGDSGVGKTALVTRISESVFTEESTPTVGAQFIPLPVEIDKRKLTLELWDTAGQEVYRSLVGFYTREAKGAFLVFDVTSDASFQGLSEWIKFVTEQAPNVKIIIFANKCDLDNRAISSDAIKEFANSHGIDVFEGSAKTGQSTVEAFEKMGEMMLDSEGNAASQIAIETPGDPKKKKK